jgi:hypothetical protein
MNDSSLMQGFVVDGTMVVMRKIFWVDEVYRVDEGKGEGRLF